MAPCRKSMFTVLWEGLMWLTLGYGNFQTPIFTAAVRAFDQKQLEGLQAIPLNKLLLETDATYFPLGGAMVSTPAYLGDVAAYLSNI